MTEPTVPTVSVVIPTYNAARFLPRAIESVLTQSYQDFEVIVVDDGSTDDTQAALQPYWDQIRYFRQQNKGASAARNRGIRMARGRFIAFLDADDRWVAEKLREQVAILEADPHVGLVCSDVEIVSQDGEYLPRYLDGKPRVSGYVFDQLLQSGFVLTSSVMARSECLHQADLFDESLPVSEDIDLWLKIAHCWRITVIPRVTVIRTQLAGGLSGDPKRTMACRVKVLHNVNRRFPDLGSHSRKILNREFSKSYWNLGYQHFVQQDPAEARKYLLQSWKYDRRRGRSLLYLLATYLPSNLVGRIRALKRAVL